MPFQTHNPRLSDQWTDERVILLLKLDAENKLSRAQIAKEMARQMGCCFSRNAIIGKLGRLRAPPKDRVKSVKKYFAQARAKRPPPEPKPLPPEIIFRESLRLSLNDLTDLTCRYPTEGIVEFCGHPVDQRSYCAAHYRICYYSPRTERPDASHRIRLINARKYRASLLKPTCEAA